MAKYICIKMFFSLSWDVIKTILTNFQSNLGQQYLEKNHGCAVEFEALHHENYIEKQFEHTYIFKSLNN